MPRSRFSLIYLAAYLIGSGVSLLAAPTLTLKLLFSDGHYGEVIPRMVGALALALGIIVVQIFRLRIHSLYLTLVFVRVMLCSVWLVLFGECRDPFFLVLFTVVGFGLTWTAIGYWLDRRASEAR